MIDQRYSRPQVNNKLPQWIRKQLIVQNQFGPCFGQICKVMFFFLIQCLFSWSMLMGVYSQFTGYFFSKPTTRLETVFSLRVYRLKIWTCRFAVISNFCHWKPSEGRGKRFASIDFDSNKDVFGHLLNQRLVIWTLCQ